MGACATKPKAVDGTAPEVASSEQPTTTPAEATREVEAVVVAAEESNEKVEEKEVVTVAPEVVEPKVEAAVEPKKGDEVANEETKEAVVVEQPKTEETAPAS